jgi:hypothetical protein
VANYGTLGDRLAKREGDGAIVIREVSRPENRYFILEHSSVRQSLVSERSSQMICKKITDLGDRRTFFGRFLAIFYLSYHNYFSPFSVIGVDHSGSDSSPLATNGW